MSHETEFTLRVLDIVEGTSVDGPGLRTSIYFAGCHHQCPGCHNPQSWDMQGGREMTITQIIDVVEKAGFNATFSGGDPLYQLPALTVLAGEIHQRGYNLWCYTGFTLEQLTHLPGVGDLLNNIDVLVDGPFIEHLKDLSLHFRGSSNQRLIDIPSTLACGEVTLWQPPTFEV